LPSLVRNYKFESFGLVSQLVWHHGVALTTFCLLHSSRENHLLFTRNDLAHGSQPLLRRFPTHSVPALTRQRLLRADSENSFLLGFALRLLSHSNTDLLFSANAIRGHP
jgi:hypothetical protein